MEKILFYIILMPLSYLPIPILYGISDFFYVILLTVFPYRKDIILKNISRCYPDLSEKEKKKLKRKFYFHLSNLLAEGIKNLSISQRRLKKRFIIENTEIFDRFFEEGKSVIIASSHYSNWEYLITVQNLVIKQHAIGIGKPLSKKFMNKKINALRERNGMKVVSAKNYKEDITQRIKDKELMAILALADQKPTLESAFWHPFFNVETSFTFGPEYMAHQFNFPVVFLKTRRIKRGYYRSEASIITSEPQNEPHGSITKKYIRFLEDQIKEKPEHWLWSHKRFKHKIPTDLESVKKKHQDFFNQRFGKAKTTQ